MIARVWLPKEANQRRQRDLALTLLEEGGSESRLALHWGLLVTAFPFFASVADVVGKVLALEGTCPGALVTRRMREAWGDRTTVLRAAPPVVATMRKLGVLVEAGRRNVFGPAARRPVIEGPVAAFLLQSRLVAAAAPVALGDFDRSPQFFPFEVRLDRASLAADPELEFSIRGSAEVVSLAARLRE